MFFFKTSQGTFFLNVPLNSINLPSRRGRLSVTTLCQTEGQCPDTDSPPRHTQRSLSAAGDNMVEGGGDGDMESEVYLYFNLFDFVSILFVFV